ncbi:hypothetical protein Ciccas_001078 [Cichlidogyrus casuarinus]|uniref:Uncharacterized protein n=1 Tax=Cichlidogyrus casuarinus TaxID=1844966 RepID=A0ABD2QND8_9PLAT
MHGILSVMKEHSRTETAFPMSVGMKVNFTRQKLHDLNNPLECKNIAVHFNFMTVAETTKKQPAMWTGFTSDLLKCCEKVSPHVTISWDSDWPSKKQMVQSAKVTMSHGSAEKLKNTLPVADRDGMFLNEMLEDMLIEGKMTRYQEVYRKKIKFN